jgi:disulfide oxidoreductase YuzD
MERRFGDRARIAYFDVSKPDVRMEHAGVVDAIHDEGLVYPVTLLGEELVCDGAVSYPAVLRAVDAALADGAE